MSGDFMITGTCPVCGTVHTTYHPMLTMYRNIEESHKHEEICKRFPYAVWKCYHNGTPHHDNKNYTSSAGSPVPMHLYFRSSGDIGPTDGKYHRFYPDAGNDCNKRHWKI
jgi:hypothetical protein